MNLCHFAGEHAVGVLEREAAEGEMLDVFALRGTALEGDQGRRQAPKVVPGDAVLDVADRDVAVTAAYGGRRRMTLTYPALDRSRRILWLVTGADKGAVVPRLLAADRSIPGNDLRTGGVVQVGRHQSHSNHGPVCLPSTPSAPRASRSSGED